MCLFTNFIECYFLFFFERLFVLPLCFFCLCLLLRYHKPPLLFFSFFLSLQHLNKGVKKVIKAEKRRERMKKIELLLLLLSLLQMSRAAYVGVIEGFAWTDNDSVRGIINY